MVMVSPEMNPTICWLFEAEIVLLFHAKTFHRGFQVTVHVGNVRQTATVEELQGKVRLRLNLAAFYISDSLYFPSYILTFLFCLTSSSHRRICAQVRRLWCASSSSSTQNTWRWVPSCFSERESPKASVKLPDYTLWIKTKNNWKPGLPQVIVSVADQKNRMQQVRDLQ